MHTTPDIGRQTMGAVAPKLAELTDQVLFGDIWQRPQDNGLDRVQLAELITHLAFYAGWPCAASAVTILRQLDSEATP